MGWLPVAQRPLQRLGKLQRALPAGDPALDNSPSLGPQLFSKLGAGLLTSPPRADLGYLRESTFAPTLQASTLHACCRPQTPRQPWNWGHCIEAGAHWVGYHVATGVLNAARGFLNNVGRSAAMWALNVARDALRVAERGAEAVLKGTQWFTRESARFALETAKKVRGRGRGKRCYLGCCASGEGVCMRASVHACVRAVACMICMQSQACMHWHANARMFKPTRAHTWHGPQVSDGVLKGTEAAAIETANTNHP